MAQTITTEKKGMGYIWGRLWVPCFNYSDCR